ncbi:hypothetical protein [Sporosarcina thermotolerans]|uniref:hypothetical protein n=1 Tax=Sporosarcina thermotolerans TaxID=633404 RepID=UPI00321C28E1
MTLANSNEMINRKREPSALSALNWVAVRPYMMVFPAIIVFTLFFLYPIGYMIYLSFFDELRQSGQGLRWLFELHGLTARREIPASIAQHIRLFIRDGVIDDQHLFIISPLAE